MKYNFNVCDYLLGVNDSMELESGQSVAELNVKDEVLIDLRVEGDVRVVFEDQVYKCSSQMPDELIDLFHKGGDEYQNALESGRLYIDDNNWFEVFVYTKNPNYKGNESEPKWIWTGISDVVDGGWDNPAEVFSFLLDCYDEYIKDNEEQKKTFLITITKTVSTEVEVSAENEAGAVEKALSKVRGGNVEWHDDGEPKVVEIDG